LFESGVIVSGAHGNEHTFGGGLEPWPVTSFVSTFLLASDVRPKLDSKTLRVYELTFLLEGEAVFPPPEHHGRDNIPDFHHNISKYIPGVLIMYKPIYCYRYKRGGSSKVLCKNAFLGLWLRLFGLLVQVLHSVSFLSSDKNRVLLCSNHGFQVPVVVCGPKEGNRLIVKISVAKSNNIVRMQCFRLVE
jgi:hypothetical protein